MDGARKGIIARTVPGPIPLALKESEQQLRRALAISQGDPSVFVTRPIAAAIPAVAAAVLLAPYLLRLFRRPA